MVDVSHLFEADVRVRGEGRIEHLPREERVVVVVQTGRRAKQNDGRSHAVQSSADGLVDQQLQAVGPLPPRGGSVQPAHR